MREKIIDCYPQSSVNSSTFIFDNIFMLFSHCRTELTKEELAEEDEFENEIYNPFANRPIEYSNSTLGSLVHLLKSSLGTGILAMPMAFKNSGLLVGAIGTLVLGFICTHCIHILVSHFN